jgi:putative transposase
VIVHSDAGSSYISFEYRTLLQDLGMLQSMGSSGDVYDNAAMESMNGIIKTECLYNRFGKTRIENHQVSAEEVRPVIEAFMDWYNNERPKEALGWLSPVMFRELNPMGKCPMFIQSGLTDERS